MFSCRRCSVAARYLVVLGLAVAPWTSVGGGERQEFSGIYPHLATFNEENECGTGAVVPWAGRLWVISYGPHLPNGSSDKLYEIDDQLVATIRPESVGGTPANRMIHRESGQLFIGPYVIDPNRRVRVIPPKDMPGRLTANMRHLYEPAGRIYCATMEEGLYDVDVKTLAVRVLYPDANRLKGGVSGSLLPGYHGKGAYSGQGRVVYANNGEYTPEAMRRADIESGCLAEWNGKDWRVVRRNQFTEVTGPGGIFGSEHPETDPIWSIGWDYRSLLLMLLDRGQWHVFRLPKATHTYDGAHGWNTEWPRIRDIGEDRLLMTMHGTFWRFPPSFSAANTAGIRPRATYLKVIGDFARWNERVVFGCDDTAKAEFLNKRKVKGGLAPPGQSQSNLWFVDPMQLDQLGPALGRGGVWINEDLAAGQWSDPYLFAGYDRRGVHLNHATPESVVFEFEVDASGRSEWKPLRSVTVPAAAYAWVEFPERDKGEWIRVRATGPCRKATALFEYSQADRRTAEAGSIFDGLATASAREYSGGLIRCRGEGHRTLHMGSMSIQGQDAQHTGYYELDGAMKLRRVDDAKTHEWLRKNAAIPSGFLRVDDASVLYVDDSGHRWRLPKGDPALDRITGTGLSRIDREVVTERDLFNAHGTFYELPAENAGGFAKIRPITTHNRAIVDYGSYRGLLVLTGIAGGQGNRHVIRSDDGQAAVWVGAVDDLWQLGKPRGVGGPWKESPTAAGQPSDPYLMTGYDGKTIRLAHDANESVRFSIQIDITGDAQWVTYRELAVPSGKDVVHEFPDGFSAYWVRVLTDRSCRATAVLTYD